MSLRRTTPRANARPRLIAAAVCTLAGVGVWAVAPAMSVISALAR